MARGTHRPAHHRRRWINLSLCFPRTFSPDRRPYTDGDFFLKDANCRLRSPMGLTIRPLTRALRLSVRTSDFHSEKRGSTPLGRATFPFLLLLRTTHARFAAGLAIVTESPLTKKGLLSKNCQKKRNHRLRSPMGLTIRPLTRALRLSVRTSDFHSEKRGSTPLGRATSSRFFSENSSIFRSLPPDARKSLRKAVSDSTRRVAHAQLHTL